MRRNVIAALSVVLLVSLVLGATGCGSPGKWKDGTYTGEGQGHNGPVKVNVEVSGGKIKTVTITDHTETAGIADAAIERVPKAIIEKQSTQVDAVSGATYTSKAIMDAVTSALASAENN
jgi:fumarate reductase flavoprotein subunit